VQEDAVHYYNYYFKVGLVLMGACILLGGRVLKVSRDINNGLNYINYNALANLCPLALPMFFVAYRIFMTKEPFFDLKSLDKNESLQNTTFLYNSQQPQSIGTQGHPSSYPGMT